MKCSLLLIFFLFLTETFAQTDYTRVYHPIINDAELAIVDDDHATALSLYKEAFNLVDKPFAKDYYNAAICAVYTNRLSLAYDYLEHLVEKGYVIDSLRKDKFFGNLADTSSLWKGFEKRMASQQTSINYVVRDSLKHMLETILTDSYKNMVSLKYEKDKVINVMFGDSILAQKQNVDFMNDIKARKEIDSLMRYFSSSIRPKPRFNSENLEKLIDAYGFPDENLAGLSDYSLTFANRGGRQTILKSPISLESNFLIDIMRNQPTKDKNYIFKAARDGHLLPKHAKLLLTSYTNQYDYLEKDHISVFQVRVDNTEQCQSDVKQKLEKWYLKKEKPSDMTEIELNEKRMAIGLSKIEDNYKKILFKATYPDTPFILHCGQYRQEVSYVSSCDAAERTIRESEELR